MKTVFHWYDSGFGPIPLKYIRQVPGATGVVSTLIDVPTGEL